MSRKAIVRASAWMIVARAIVAGSPVLAEPTSPIARQFIHRAWGTPEGLPQNSVTSILQTRDGYLWLGTFGGLVRFDGHTFTVFDPGNSPGLSSSRIVTLHEDRKGVLWIGTEVGLTRFEGGRFTTYTTRDGLPHDGIHSILEDKRGRLWVGTGDGLARFDGRTLSRVLLDGLYGVALTFAEAPNGDVWAGTWTGLRHFTDGEKVAVVNPAGGLAAGAVWCLLVDAKGRLWAGSEALGRWDGTRFVEVPLPGDLVRHGGISALSEDREGNLWIGTRRGGVYRWREGVVDAYAANDGLTNDAVRSLLADREGNVWVGTDVGGLNRLKPRRVFSYLTGGRSIGPITDDGAGGLWIGGTCGGLLHFRAGAFRVYESKDGLPHPCVWALHRDPDGTLWIGTHGGGLTRLEDGRFSTYTELKDGLAVDLVHAISRDRDGVLWVGTSRGLSRFQDGRFTNYGRGDGLPHGAGSITQDRSGALWLGGVGGVSRFKDGRFTTYTKAQGLSHDHVRAIYEDEDAALWIGTYGGGLNRFKDGRFTRYGIKDGLHDSAVSRIIEDDRGNLWMSGNKGVFRVARTELNAFAEGRTAHVTSVSYGTADGMVIDETNGGQPAGWRTPDGKLWFPTIKGLVGIEPVAGAAKPPPVFVERVTVDGQALDPGVRAALGPGKGDAEFHYTAVDLGAAEKTRFRYRLAGYDNAWVDAGTRRVAYYTNIPPGHYGFEVVAASSDGVWNTRPASLALVVLPFWWQRLEVQGAALALLLVMTGAGVRFVALRRTRARLAMLEHEHALERERTRIARDLHDDLGSRLSLIGLITEGTQASDVARDAAETLDQLVWTVDVQNDTVASFAAYASRFAEEHLDAAGVSHRFHIQPELGRHELGAETRRQVYLAFKEAINNVVKHARATEVHVAIGVTGRALMVEVADNGCGFPAGSGDPTGVGLNSMRDRLEAVGGSLDVESAPGTGTRIVFRTPLCPSSPHVEKAHHPRSRDIRQS